MCVAGMHFFQQRDVLNDEALEALGAALDGPGNLSTPMGKEEGISKSPPSSREGRKMVKRIIQSCMARKYRGGSSPSPWPSARSELFTAALQNPHRLEQLITVRGPSTETNTTPVRISCKRVAAPCGRRIYHDVDPRWNVGSMVSTHISPIINKKMTHHGGIRTTGFAATRPLVRHGR